MLRTSRPADARSRRGAHRRRRRVQAARRAGTERGVLRRARTAPGTATTRCSRRSSSAAAPAAPCSGRRAAPSRHHLFIANDMPGEAEVHARAAGDWPMVGRSPPNAGSRGPSMASTRTTACWRGAGRGHRRRREPDDPRGGGGLLPARPPRCGARTVPSFVDGRAPDSAAGADPTDPLTSVPPLARPLLAVCYARAFGADARARAAIADLRGADDAATTARLASSGPSAWTSTMGGSSEPGERQPPWRRRPTSRGSARRRSRCWRWRTPSRATSSLRLSAPSGCSTSRPPPAPRAVATLALVLRHAQRGEHRRGGCAAAVGRRPLRTVRSAPSTAPCGPRCALRGARSSGSRARMRTSS